ncbi:MAG TPA: hypothetical protein PKL08_13395, partial [Thermoanaerobaculaceae bacterium]|nr:hypothetical protein [Thermoanaerobaculaceae bacterium]
HLAAIAGMMDMARSARVPLSESGSELAESLNRVGDELHEILGKATGAERMTDGVREPLNIYKHELEDWAARTDVRLWQTVDPGGQTPDWHGEIGFVPAIVEKAAPTADNAYAVVCGPPIMIKFTLPVLAKLGFPPERVYTTLENRMKCGLGKCGRCNVGPVYVCKDGPVFSAAELAQLPAEF